MSLQSKYRRFANNIALTRESEAYKKAREKDDLITPKVEAAFKDEGYTVDSSFLQGSLAVNTGVIPLDGDYDIDRAIAITKSTAPDNSVEPKKIIKRVLLEHGFKEPKIRKPCVTAEYKSGEMHIDYPTYRVEEILGGYQLAVGKENSDENNRSWADADPKGLNDWVKSRTNHQGGFFSSELTSEEKQQFYRLVRYVKRWRDVQYTSKDTRSKIYSIALTIMLNESFKPSVNEDGVANDHRALKETLEVALEEGTYFRALDDDQWDIVVLLPVAPESDAFKGKGAAVATVLRNRLNKLLGALNDVDQCDMLADQCEILRKQFGDDFPEGGNGTSGDKNARAKSESPGIVGVSSGA